MHGKALMCAALLQILSRWAIDPSEGLADVEVDDMRPSVAKTESERGTELRSEQV
jgi:hypothetical protein